MMGHELVPENLPPSELKVHLSSRSRVVPPSVVSVVGPGRRWLWLGLGYGKLLAAAAAAAAASSDERNVATRLSEGDGRAHEAAAG